MVNQIEREIFVLRDASCIAQPIEYVQGTNAVPILFHIRDYEIQEGTIARVCVQWPSTKGEYDADGVTVNGNDILIEPKDTLFSEVGKSSLQICLVNGEKTLVTFSYPVMVKKNNVPGITDPAKNHSDFLDQYLGEIDKNIEITTRQVQETATAEKNAKSYMQSASASAEASAQSESNAKESEALAKQYMEQTFKTTPEGYNELVKKVDLMDIKTSTDTTLYNSKKGGYRLNELLGNSEQGKTEGYQLLDFSQISTSGATVEVLEKGKTVKVTGSKAYAKAEIRVDVTALVGKTLYLTGSISGGIKPSYTFRAIKKDGTGIYPSDMHTNGYTISEEDTHAFVQMIVNNSATAYDSDETVTFTNTLLSTTKGVPFEPYTNGASPNPNFPQAIENVGDCVKLVQGWYGGGDGKWANNLDQVCNSFPIPCKEGDTIELISEHVGDKYFQVYNNGVLVNQYYIARTEEKGAITVPSGATHFNFSCAKSGGITPQTAGEIQLKVNGKYVVVVKVSGKNVLMPTFKGKTVNGLTITANEDNSITINGTATDLTDIYASGSWANVNNVLSVDKGKFVFHGTGTSSVYMFIIKNSSSIRETQTGGNITLNIESGGIHSLMYRVPKGVTLNNYTVYPMVCDADIYAKDNTYEPYTEHVEYIYIDELLRAGDRIVRKDGVVGVDGYSYEYGAWETISSCEKTSNGKGYRIEAKLPFTALSNTAETTKCTHARWTSDWSVVNGYTISSTRDNVFIIIPTDKLSDGTKADAKSWLIDNGVKLQYLLATPTFTPLDTESQKAINRLKTFDTVTYIEVDSKIQPSGISGEYGTSQVGALSIENENLHNLVELSTVKGSVANTLATTEEGFVLDARQGVLIDERLVAMETEAVKKGDIVVATTSVAIGTVAANTVFGVDILSDYPEGTYVILAKNVYLENNSNNTKKMVVLSNVTSVANNGKLGINVLVSNSTERSTSEVVRIKAEMTLLKIA